MGTQIKLQEGFNLWNYLSLEALWGKQLIGLRHQNFGCHKTTSLAKIHTADRARIRVTDASIIAE